MTDLDLLIDLHIGNHRQAPGDDAETARVLSLCGLDPTAAMRVADIGCGTGASALVLAKGLSNAHITAIDAAAPFIERLPERAQAAGVAARIDARVGMMEELPFGDGELDLIWSEGAIYNMGFAEGVRAWRRHLRPGGVLAVSELSWTTAARPQAIEDHWLAEYPGIATPSAKLGMIEDAGYRPIAVYFLPHRCWEENYYAPLRAGSERFLDRHAHSEAAKAIIAAEEAESELHRDLGRWYGYAFYIAARTDDA